MIKLVHIHRRFMTLLELLIGLGLAAVLLTTLTFFYQQIQAIDSESEKIGKEQFQMRYVGNRLSKIIPNALGEYELKEHFSFFTSNDLHGLLAPNNPSLVFVFDNGPSLDSELANHALARLYLDKEKRLSLATWSSPERWETEPPSSVHKELLMENVESLGFQFFVAPERDRSLIKTNLDKKSSNKDAKTKINAEADSPLEPDRKGEWVSEWQRDYKSLPAMMKILITRKKRGSDELEKIIYAYPLPNSQKLIVYEQ